ncbi:thioredoxin domain-containing protein 1 [Trichinella spiralis]|uniref:thioredoxin domain-containing protein 1 n=1 Tax=Trichinella spiralis TaxID=6334 RepID=UPI0001EFE5CC|nr:thioredoxin domain-containing protein 1 [Trichinella spiralis]
MLAYSEIALLSGLCLVLLVGLLAGCLFRRKKKEEKKKPLKRMKPENPRPIKLAERPTPPDTVFENESKSNLPMHHQLLILVTTNLTC